METSGFPTHHNKKMESTTIVLDGGITHQDSARTRSVIEAADMQHISA